MVRIAAADQRSEREAGMFGENTAESPAASDRAHKVMPATIKWQFVVAGYPEALAHVVVGAALVNRLREWVSFLEADLIGRKVDGVAPGIQRGNCEAPRKRMRKLSDHGIEAGVSVGKRYKDTAKPVVAHHNGCWTRRI